MAHPIPKFRRPEHLAPGWQEAEPNATQVGVSGSMTHITATTIAEAAVPIGVSGQQLSTSTGTIGG